MSTQGESGQTRPTVIEGLKRRSVSGALRAACIDCGAQAQDWRRLLGAGATFFAAPGDAGRMVVQCADACRVCGSNAIIVTAR